MVWKIAPCNLGFTKFQLCLPYSGLQDSAPNFGNPPLSTVCDISETGIYKYILPLIR